MGARIIWADIDPLTLCIDEEDIRRKITNKTRAIVVVHLGGIAAKAAYFNYYKGDDIPERIPVICDAAQALGVFTGDYTCCSFQAIKHITTGDGGMLVCPNAPEAKQAKLMRWFGIDREKKISNNWQAYRERKMTFDIDVPGTKRHMTDIAASMGLVGLEHYNKVIEHRKKLFEMYQYGLLVIDGINMVDGCHYGENSTSSTDFSHRNTYWLATVLVERRDDFARMLFENGVDTNMVQVRNDIYKIFGGQRAELPVMNQLEDKYLSLPLGMHVSLDNVQFICDLIKKGW